MLIVELMYFLEILLAIFPLANIFQSMVLMIQMYQIKYVTYKFFSIYSRHKNNIKSACMENCHWIKITKVGKS